MLALPRVIGHRGAAGLAPENTLASFALAADLGCAMVEFDVRLTADGVPIVFHDDTLDRCTAATGPVGSRTLAALRPLGIPTLDEVLVLCRARGLRPNIEIKPDRGAEHDTARRALDLALRLWPADRPPPLVSSFADAALATAAMVAPGWPRGLLVGRPPADWRARAEALGCVALCAAQRALTRRFVRQAKEAGFAVLAYTVNDPARARTLWNWGADAVFSDRPDLMS